MIDNPQPDEDTAADCQEHESCIRGFKRQAIGDLAPLAGWWHLGWDQNASQWNITAPNGEMRYAIVQAQDAGFPPAALIGAVPELEFRTIVSAILEKGLFPPPR